MFFVDLVGSTRLAATRPAVEVVALLNRFFAVVVDEVERCGGFVDKFEEVLLRGRTEPTLLAVPTP